MFCTQQSNAQETVTKQTTEKNKVTVFGGFVIIGGFVISDTIEVISGPRVIFGFRHNMG